MLTGAIRSQVDQVWNAFWAGGIALFASLQHRAFNGEL
jgi:hypothetical protein